MSQPQMNIEITFQQEDLLDNMEAFLRKKGDEEQDPILKKNRYELADEIKKSNGLCHGFALYFLNEIHKDFMSQDKNSPYLQDHFSNLRKMAAWDGKELDHSLEIIFEKVIAHLQWLQNPISYISGSIQSDIEVLMEGVFERDRAYYDIFSLQAFKEFLATHLPEGRPILIESSNHAAAIYRIGNEYYCREPNDEVGLMKFFDARDVADYYFQQFRKNYPSDPSHLPITLNIYKSAQQQTCGLETYGKYVEEQIQKDSDFINRVTADGTTLLWLTMTDGNLRATELLLKKGAQINFKKNVVDDARTLKQNKMVDLFLSYPNSNPLFFAISNNNHAAIIKELKNGADIFIKNKFDKSALDLAIERCTDPNVKKEDKIENLKTLRFLLDNVADTSKLRQACFDTLLKNSQLMAQQNPEVAFLLMDKHCGADLAICVDEFLIMPKVVKPSSGWMSMFKKPPQENDHIFETILQQKIANLGQNANSPEKLNDAVIDVIKECAKQNFSDDFKNRINFITKYLGHRTHLQNLEESLKEVDFKLNY